MSDFDLTAYQRDISDSVARIWLEKGSVAALSAELLRHADQAETKIVQQDVGDRSLIACGPGCGSCCVVNVSVLLPEGFAIARYVADWPATQRENLTQRMEELWSVVRGLDDEERMAVRRNCAFLSPQGTCWIYPVRPLLCRGVTSTAAEACRAALADTILDEEMPVLMHQFQQEIYATIFSGFGNGLEEQGLDGRSFQVSGLIRFLLDHPEWKENFRTGCRLSWEDLY